MPRSEVNLVTLSVTMRDMIPLSVLMGETVQPPVSMGLGGGGAPSNTM